MWEPEDVAAKPEFITRLLSGTCIKGIVFSGRPEAGELLEYYRTHPEDDTSAYLTGAIVDAAFFANRIEELGLGVMMDVMMADPETATSHFRDWLETADGQTWRAWSRSLESNGEQRP
jgi:hypothetical protein